MHYNSRWEAHVASQKLEAKQVDEIKEKIVELEDNGTELKDYTWLSQVMPGKLCPVRKLLQCLLGCLRAPTSYIADTYVFAGTSAAVLCAPHPGQHLRVSLLFFWQQHVSG